MDPALEREVRLEFVRAAGPGGQNVNKVATAVQLRLDLRSSRALPPDVRERLLAREANRVNAAGELVILARRFRTQEANRRDALERLARMVERAAVPPRPRRATRPTRASRERRLDGKRRTAERKKLRGRPGPGGD